MTLCADCDSPAVEWVSLTKCVLLCGDCASIHRSLGRHISYVKPIKLLKKTPQYKLVEAINKTSGNIVWEDNLSKATSKHSAKAKPTKDCKLYPTKDEFIRAKYLNLAYCKRPDESISPSELSKSLHTAVKTPHLESTLRCISLGANVNMKNGMTGMTPLHVAAQTGQEVQVELLFVHGADVNCVDFEDRLPEEYAREARRMTLAARLQEMRYDVTDKLTQFMSTQTPCHAKGEHLLIPRLKESLCESPRVVKHALEKLQALSDEQFIDLVADLYDEVDRRERDGYLLSTSKDPFSEPCNIVPFLPLNPSFSSTRNQGRQKLARFNSKELNTFIRDVLIECRRRELQLQPEQIDLSTGDALALSPKADNEYDELPNETFWQSQQQTNGKSQYLNSGSSNGGSAPPISPDSIDAGSKRISRAANESEALRMAQDRIHTLEKINRELEDRIKTQEKMILELVERNHLISKAQVSTCERCMRSSTGHNRASSSSNNTAVTNSSSRYTSGGGGRIESPLGNQSHRVDGTHHPIGHDHEYSSPHALMSGGGGLNSSYPNDHYNNRVSGGERNSGMGEGGGGGRDNLSSTFDQMVLGGGEPKSSSSSGAFSDASDTAAAAAAAPTDHPPFIPEGLDTSYSSHNMSGVDGGDPNKTPVMTRGDAGRSSARMTSHHQSSDPGAAPAIVPRQGSTITHEAEDAAAAARLSSTHSHDSKGSHSSGGSTGDAAAVSRGLDTEQVRVKMELLTRKIKVMWQACQECRQDAFVPCSENIRAIVLEFIGLFSQEWLVESGGLAEMKRHLETMESQSYRLEIECKSTFDQLEPYTDRDLIDAVISQIFMCCMNIAKAVKAVIHYLNIQ